MAGDSRVNVHSPSQREGAGGRENPDRAGMGSLPTSPRWEEETERLHSRLLLLRQILRYRVY
jgi:hypothetical protein